MKYKDKLLFLVFVLFILFYSYFCFCSCYPLIHFWIYGYVHVRSNKRRPLLATMATSCHTSTMAVPEVHGHCDCAVHGSEQPIASFSRPREPPLCDQSCMLLEFDLLLNWESLRSHGANAESFAWTSTSTAWHAWSQDTQGLSDQRPMQATKQWQARHTGNRVQPTPLGLGTHSSTDHNLWKKSLLPRAHMHPFPRFSCGQELPIACIWWIMYDAPKMPKLL